MNVSLLCLLPPEAQLVLLAAGGVRHDGRMRELLRGDLDWRLVSAIGAREGAAAVLWERIRKLHGGAEVPAAAEALRPVGMLAEFKQLLLEQRLREAVATLGARGIAVVALKGVALGLGVYESLAQRPMSDIDLLVAPADAARAQRLLLAGGWRESRHAAQASFYSVHHHLAPLDDGQGTGVEIELHTDLFFSGHPFEPLRELMREGAAARADLPATLLLPRLEHSLLHLCLHFAWSHLLSSGAWRTFRDVETILARGEVDWEEFVHAAAATRGATCCYWTLRLAERLLGAPVPPEVLAALHPRLPRPVLALLERHLTYQLLPAISLCPSLRLGYAAWEQAIRPTWSGHGAVRPWDRNDDFAPAARQHAAPHSHKVLNHLRNARAWGSYLSAVIRGTPRRAANA